MYIGGVFLAWFNEFIDKFMFCFVDNGYYKWLLEGFGNSLIITGGSIIVGLLLGMIVAGVRASYDKNAEALSGKKGFGVAVLKIVNAICKLYITVIRGIPVVVQLMIWYFVILVSQDNDILVAIIAFGFNSGAYVAEIFRGGIMSIDNGQFEAGRSLGFGYIKTMIYIVMPQMFKVVLPTLLNEIIALLKETSVAGYVGIMDLTKAGDLIRGRTFEAFYPLIGVAIIYLVTVILLSALFTNLERRLRAGDK